MASGTEADRETDIGLRRNIDRLEENVKQFESDAARADRSGDPRAAEEARELAGQNRAGIAARAEELQRREAGTDKYEPGDYIDDPMWNMDMKQTMNLEKAADVLDDRVRLLEQAAADQRWAEENPGDSRAAAFESRAQAALAKAEDTRPDYSTVDATTLREAGIEASEIPGPDPDPIASAAGSDVGDSRYDMGADVDALQARTYEPEVSETPSLGVGVDDGAEYAPSGDGGFGLGGDDMLADPGAGYAAEESYEPEAPAADEEMSYEFDA